MISLSAFLLSYPVLSLLFTLIDWIIELGVIDQLGRFCFFTLLFIILMFIIFCFAYIKTSLELIQGHIWAGYMITWNIFFFSIWSEEFLSFCFLPMWSFQRKYLFWGPLSPEKWFKRNCCCCLDQNQAQKLLNQVCSNLNDSCLLGQNKVILTSFEKFFLNDLVCISVWTLSWELNLKIGVRRTNYPITSERSDIY